MNHTFLFFNSSLLVKNFILFAGVGIPLTGDTNECIDSNDESDSPLQETKFNDNMSSIAAKIWCVVLVYLLHQVKAHT